MDEAEWLACTAPTPMLEFQRGKASDRKLRLFACACCRQIWHWITDERSQQGVVTAERYADGVVGIAELNAAATVAWAAYEPDEFTNAPLEGLGYNAAYAAASATGTNVRIHRPDGQMVVDRTTWYSVRDAVESVLWVGGRDNATGNVVASQDQLFRCRLSTLIRCITGNPFHPISPDPVWQTPNAVALGQTIYDERRWELLPLLADLLEEVGCPADVSDHCRSGGLHARGCWVVDLVLGKS